MQKAVEEFSSGQAEDDVDSFVSGYVDLRKLVHMRRVKVDKLTQHLRAPPRRDPALAAPPVPARNSPIPPYAAAYPAQPPVHGTTPGYPHMAPYPPIGASNGWAQQYPNGPAPVAFMRQ